MQKVDNGEYSVTFTKIEPAWTWNILSCGEPYKPVWGMVNVCGRTVPLMSYEKGKCHICGKYVDAYYCNKCMVGAQ